MVLGSYTAVGPKDVRKARDAAKAQKSAGYDPVKVRKVAKLKASLAEGSTFKAVAMEWYTEQAPQWSPSHAPRSLRQLERDLFPLIGAGPIADIHAMERLAAHGQVQQRNITEGVKGRLTPYRG